MSGEEEARSGSPAASGRSGAAAPDAGGRGHGSGGALARYFMGAQVPSSLTPL